METYIVVGLGNPGKEYAHTRHNVGFDVTDILAERWHAPLNKKKLGGMLTEVPLDGKRVVLCQPQTFMNLSGECVIQLLNWYKCPLENLLVIYDDIDLPVARLRVRKSGSAGTHNGMRSIIGNLPGQNFPRIRVGVGAPAHPEHEMVDWVIGQFTPAERKELNTMLEKAADAAECLIREGVQKAQNRYN